MGVENQHNQTDLTSKNGRSIAFKASVTLITLLLTLATVVIALKVYQHQVQTQKQKDHAEAVKLVHEAWDLLNASQEQSAGIKILTRSEPAQEQARRNLEQAEDLSPEYPKLYIVWAMYHQSKGRPRDARISIDKALALDRTDAAAWVTSVQIAIEAKDFKLALHIANRGLNYTDAPQLMINRAVALFALDQHQVAIKSLNDYLELEPQNKDLAEQLGKFYQEVGILDQSVSMYKHALAIDENSITANHNLAMLYRDLKHFDAALKHISTVLNQVPLDFNALMIKGTILSLMGNTDGEIETYRLILKHGPSHIEAAINLANTLADLSLLDEARQTLDNIEIFHADSDAVMHARSYIEYMAGNNQLALQLLDEAIDRGGETELRREFKKHLLELTSPSET